MTALVTGNTRAPLIQRGADLYETPACATRALMRAENLPAPDLGTRGRSWRDRQCAAQRRPYRICQRSY